ncbi:MAG: MFS transporter [Acidimicrobiales bacterium]
MRKRSRKLAAADNRALISIGVQFWMNGVVIASFVPRFPEIRTRLGIDVDQLGLLLTFGVVGGFAASAACGGLIDRFGTKAVMTTASLGVIVTLPLLGLASSPLGFLAALAALQFFDVLIDVPMNLQGSWLSARRQVPVINRLHGLWSVGAVTGGIGATIAASRISLDVHLLAVSIMLLAALAFIVPRLPTDDAAVDSPAVDSPAADEAGLEPPPTNGTTSLRLDEGTPPKWLVLATFAALGALAIVSELVPGDWGAIRLVDDLDVDPGAAGLAFVGFTVGMVVGRFGGDSASSKLGRGRLSRLAVIVGTGGIAVATLSSSPPLAIGGFFVAGLGTAVIFPGLYDVAARAPGRPGDVLGAMTAGIRVGLLVVPVTVGTLASGSLSVGQAMLVVAVPAAVAFWLLSWSVERL